MIKNIYKYFTAFLMAVFKPLRVWQKPIHIQIEPTTFCNLNCPHCPREEYIDRQSNLSYENFIKIIDKIEPLNLSLNGLGETFLNSEIFRMIKYAKSRGIKVNSISNFSIINNSGLKELAESGLDLLSISLDATNKETYQMIRKQDLFDKIIDNIKNLQRLKKELNSRLPLIRLSFVIEKDNFKEITDFYNLARELGADAILYQLFTAFDQDKKFLINGINTEELNKKIDEIIGLEKKYKKPITNALFLKNKINIINKIYSGQKVNLVKRCVMPWISAYVTVEGDVRYCCHFCAKKISAGNVLSADNMMAIFNNQAYQDFRQKMKNGLVPDGVCADCLPESPFDILEKSKWTPNFIFRK